MSCVENKENNAKTQTEDKSPSKNIARRSVLKEFDPFYSSPHQTVNKPTAINEEEDVASDDTEINNKLEISIPELLLEVSASKQDFDDDTPKTSRLSTESLQIKNENLQEELAENDDCAINKNFSAKSIREEAVLETSESFPARTEYFECQEPKSNNIVFVDTHFNGTFDQTQNMDASDPLGGGPSGNYLDQDSVYEECLEISTGCSIASSYETDNVEPENGEILEIINRSFEEALDGNDVEIEDSCSQDGNFEIVSIIDDEDNVVNPDTDIDDGEVQSIKKEEKDTSFVNESEGTDDKSTAFEDQHRNNSVVVEVTKEGNISCKISYEDDSVVKKDAVQFSEDVYEAAKLETGTKDIISEATETEVAQKVSDKLMDTTIEVENEAVETTHENQLKDVSFIIEEQVQSPEAAKVEILHVDQHENSIVTEETDSKDIISEAAEVEVAQNVSYKPMDTTFEGKNEDQLRDSSFVKEDAVQSTEKVTSEAAKVETVQDDQHKNTTFVTDSENIISETTEVEVPQNVSNKAMDTTFEGKYEDQLKASSFVKEDAVQSSEEVISEAAKVQDDQHEMATFVTDSEDIISETTEVEVAQNVINKAIDTKFQGKNEAAETAGLILKEVISSAVEIVLDDDPSITDETASKDSEATESEVAQNVSYKAMNTTFEGKNETVDDDQKGDATFVAEETGKDSRDIITEVAQNVTDMPMNTTFETSPEDASFVVDSNDITLEAITVQEPKETDDEPTIETKTCAMSEDQDEPMEISFVVVGGAEVNPTETYDEAMDISFESNEVPQPQEVTAQETITTFEGNIPNPRVSFNIGTSVGTSFTISDEHEAESTKCAEALAQSLNQTIDVEELAIVDDIDLNVTLEAVQISEDKSSEIQGNTEIVEEVKAGDNTKYSNVPKVHEKLEDLNKLVSEPIELAPKPKRLECRPNIRPLRNKTQVIDNPIIFQQPQLSASEDGNLVFELNLLQTELKRIQDDNAKKDQSILAHAMNRQSAKESVRKYGHIVKEYQNHVEKQNEDLQLMRRNTDQVAANLAHMEKAFSSLFKNYEKAKLAIESYKKNESILQEEITKLDGKLTEVNLEYQLVAEKCREDIKMVQEQADHKKEAYKQNLNKLQATVKRLKIKASSLESSLKQKTEECQALATLCDDILKEKPSVVS